MRRPSNSCMQYGVVVHPKGRPVARPIFNVFPLFSVGTVHSKGSDFKQIILYVGLVVFCLPAVP